MTSPLSEKTIADQSAIENPARPRQGVLPNFRTVSIQTSSAALGIQPTTSLSSDKPPSELNNRAHIQKIMTKKTYINELGQPIGCPIADYSVPVVPNFSKLQGLAVFLEPISSAHLSSLYKAFSLDTKGENWTYLPYGPFADEEEFRKWAMETCFNEDTKFYTIDNNTGPVGVASYLRMDPKIGSIEIGHIHFSPLLQRTRAGTEAIILMIEWAFEAGYRRVEWKCDELNAPSLHAAQRLGFSYEGTFKQATIYKNRNRDTAWYAMTSEEWPFLKNAYAMWRDPNNFDLSGQEIKKLSVLTKSALTDFI